MSEIYAEPGRKTITIHLDGDVDERLMYIAQYIGASEEELLTRILEGHPAPDGQHRRTFEVSGAAADRLAAVAATTGVNEEELIAEAIDHFSLPEFSGGSWWILGVQAVLLVLPVALMFLSPPIGPSGSAVAWLLFALAMLACCSGAVLLVTAVIYAEWIVIKYGLKGMVSAAGCGTAAILAVFAYIYWMLSSINPHSFNQPLTRVDAVYFTLGTFTTTGTGRFTADSAAAELLVCCQVILGWSFVAVLVALLVPRIATAYKRLSEGRIIVRVRETGH